MVQKYCFSWKTDTFGSVWGSAVEAINDIYGGPVLVQRYCFSCKRDAFSMLSNLTAVVLAIAGSPVRTTCRTTPLCKPIVALQLAPEQPRTTPVQPPRTTSRTTPCLSPSAGWEPGDAIPRGQRRHKSKYRQALHYPNAHIHTYVRTHICLRIYKYIHTRI